VCSYEPVLTKRFLHGRTEAMRSTTIKAASFCEIFCNTTSSKREKLEALRAATKEHSSYVKEAANGKGVDRHLFALKCIAEKHNLPPDDFFMSDPWSVLNHTVISTSNCGNPSLRLFGFGPVVPNGFGIGYIIRDGGFQYSISSKHRQTKRYANMLEKTLNDIGDLLSNENFVKVSRQKSANLGGEPIFSESRKCSIGEGGGELYEDPERSAGFLAPVRRRKSLSIDSLLNWGSNLGKK